MNEITIKFPFDIQLNKSERKNMLEHISVANPYSQEVCSLPRYAYKIYIAIKAAEISEDYKTLRKGLDWFSKYFTQQYYTLLD